MCAVLQLAQTAVMSQTGLPAVAVSVQVDLAVQVQNLRLQSLGESPQSYAVALTCQQLRPDTATVISQSRPQTNKNTSSVRSSHSWSHGDVLIKVSSFLIHFLVLQWTQCVFRPLAPPISLNMMRPFFFF